MQEDGDRDNQVPYLAWDTPSNSRLRHTKPCYRDHVPIDDLICRFAKMRINTPPIEKVPQELILQILDNLRWYRYTNWLRSTSAREDLLNVCQTSRQLRAAATTILYRNPQLTTAKSVGCFFFTLTRNPGLVRLVEELDGPRLSRYLKRLAYTYFNAEDASVNGILSSRRHHAGNLLPREYHTGHIDQCVSSQMLEGILRLLPRLKLLTIPQGQLLDGPYTGQIRFENLKVLRISVPRHPETSFERCPESYNRRLLSWLEPRFIGARFPVLDCLMICTPTRRWSAYFVAGNGNSASNGPLERYVHEVEAVTTSLRGFGPAEWDLMSLQQPIFDPSKFLTLRFNTPGPWDCKYAPTQSWDLDRFLVTTGQGLRTLSLDWEGRPGEGYFSPGSDWLTNLNTHEHLKTLTVSLQVIFKCHQQFHTEVAIMKDNPVSHLRLLFPESLTVLRINEFITGVLTGGDRPNGADLETTRICKHNVAVYRFIQILRKYWLTVHGDRQLWFKRWKLLDRHRFKNRNMPPSRTGLSWIMGHGDKDTVGKGYVLVTRKPLGEGQDSFDKIAVLLEEGQSDFVYMDVQTFLSFGWT